MKPTDITELKEQIKGMSSEEAIAVLTDYITTHPDDDEALTLRGLKYWGAGKRSLSINDYLAAVRINPNSAAREALKAANEILDYRNNDLYNP
ncbi:MAG: hypothetical protein HDS71_05355 [Bacteroidales bacterium]|nr:hypothetical protein [Bacteroidales bacterium]MBD5223464.1 hypothetical protein [Bacteroidales bacterium]